MFRKRVGLRPRRTKIEGTQTKGTEGMLREAKVEVVEAVEVGLMIYAAALSFLRAAGAMMSSITVIMILPVAR